MRSFLSIFIVLIIPILVVIFLRQFNSNIKHKKLPWVLGGYSLVLLVSIFALYMLPKDNFFNREIIKQDTLDYDKVAQDFYDAAKEGRLDQAKGVYRSGQWSFDLDGDKLEIADTKGEYLGISIIAERTENTDGKIQIDHYVTKSIANGIDVTKELNPPKVVLEGKKLIITSPEQYEINYVMFKKDFTVSQFLGGGNSDRDIHQLETGFGPQALYLRIPKNVQIDSKIYSVEYVGEN